MTGFAPPDYLIALPEIVLAGLACVFLMVGVFTGNRSTVPLSYASVGAMALALALVLGSDGGRRVSFGDMFVVDTFTTFMKSLVLIGAGATLVMGLGYVRREAMNRFEFPVLIVFATLGMLLMISANDLMALYVGLELQSLSAYVLASFMRRDVRSAEAGLKYFILGSLASGILLYGISLVYGFSGTTIFGDIATAYAGAEGSTKIGLLFGLVFVFAGLAFKMSAVPFHMWTPDVYEGAPTPVTAFFASAPKVAALALSVRVAVEAMGPATSDWRQIVIFAALASIVLGAVAAIGQQNIKRLLAYSSINNVGFALIGLAAGTAEGVAGVLTYMTIYIVMTLGSFLVVLQMRDADGQPVESIASLSGLSRTRPALAAALAIFMFSLAGIPPLFGFWAKFAVFEAAVKADLVALAAIGIAASTIGAYYYLKIVKTMYFDAPAPEYGRSDSPLEGGLIAAAALFVSPLGYLLIPALGAWSLAAARTLF